MQRNTRKVEKRTYTLKNVLPRFVSIVSRGANLTPLAELRYSDENAKFSEVEINRIEFSKTNFNREQVAQYMDDNDYSDYEIEESDESFMVRGVDAEAFEDIAPIEAAEGVMYFVGKVTQDSETVQASAEVSDSEVLEFNEPNNTAEETNEENKGTEDDETDGEEPKETNPEDTEDEDELDALAASDPASVEPNTNQEPSETEPELVQNSDVTEDANEETQAVFNDIVFRERAEAALASFFDALEQAKAEAFAAPVEDTKDENQGELFSQEQVDAMIATAVTTAIEQFSLENAQNDDKTIDNNVILVQNRQSSEQDDINSRSVSRNPETEKFSQRKINDLFGLK